MEENIKIDDELVEQCMKELEREHIKKITDCLCSKLMINSADHGKEHELARREVVRAILATSWVERLYFIVRSSIMTLISAIIFLAIVIFLGSIDSTLVVVIGIFTYAISLLTSRFFHQPITKVAKKITRLLDSHEKIRESVLKNF